MLPCMAISTHCSLQTPQWHIVEWNRGVCMRDVHTTYTISTCTVYTEIFVLTCTCRIRFTSRDVFCQQLINLYQADITSATITFTCIYYPMLSSSSSPEMSSWSSTVARNMSLIIICPPPF